MSEILAVDDEIWILEFVNEVLKGDGHVCTNARSGEEALEFCRRKKFDLLIVDRQMPGMDGISLVRILRRDARFNSLKILMCSAANLTGEVADALDAGADDYLLKPFSCDVLLKKVSNLLK
jgi:DNA-binding response OmpR family regulator